MKDIKKELEDFEKHCLESNQLQVAELQHYAIKRIAELEKERDELKDMVVAHQIADETGYIDGIGWVDNWADMEVKVEQALQAHNLEQQAKGVEDAFNESSRILKSKKYAKKAYLGIIDLTAELYEYGDNLRNQAKALKEQGE